MRKTAIALLALLFAVPAFGQGGIANFPQTVPPQTVVGRLGIAPGPTQAIPLSQLAAVFGASRSVTVNAKCDSATDDTAAINFDLAQGGYWTLPPGRTCNVTQLNITQSNTRLSGGGFNSSIIRGTTTGVPTINVSASLENVWLDGFQVTKSGVAVAGGTGINYTGDCQYCVLENVYVQKHWVGIAAQSTGIGYMRHVLAQLNLSDGITFKNSAVSGTLQWDLDDIFSGQNGGRGYLVAPGVAGPGAITLGSWHNIRTFANTGVGIAVACSVTIPCNGFRLTKGLLGQDGNHEIYLDTYGGLHTISASTIVELAGTSLTGPSLSTPASNTGDGVRITANNLDVSIGDLYANGNHDSGINTSASVSTNVSGFRISNHGLYGILSADCAKLTVTSVNFLSNSAAHIQCTTNNGSQLVTTSTPAALNTGTPVAITVVTGLGAGVATFLGTPSSANLRTAITDETGTSALYFQNGDLGTPSAGVGSNLTALNASNLSSGTLPAARLPAHTGDVTSSAGSAALTLAAGNAANLNSGTLLAARMPALTGDCTTSAGAVATTCTKINGVDQTTAWTTYTPTVTSGAGTPTTVSATGRSKQIGKTIFLEATVTITTVGTASGQVFVTLPTNAAANDYAGSTYEKSVTGKSGAAVIAAGNSTRLQTSDATAATWWVNGYILVIGIIYEVP